MMKAKLIVFAKSAVISFSLAAVLNILGFIDTNQMLNIAMPGFLIVTSFILLMRFRRQLEKDNRNKKK